VFSGTGFEDLTTDGLEQRLVQSETMVARIRGYQARLLAEVDARQVPLGDGCRTLVEWVGSRMDVAPETAGQLVKLTACDNKAVTAAVVCGDISFDRAVELTRLDSDTPVEDAAAYAIPRLRVMLATRRRLSRVEERDAFARRHLMLQPNLDHSGLRLWGELIGVDSARVAQILTDRADHQPRLPDGTWEPRPARMADALTGAVIDSATATTIPIDSAPIPAATVVSVFVDAGAATATNGQTGVELAGGTRLGAQALEAILCDSVTEVTAVTTDGQILGVGDRSPTIPPRIRRYIHWRDKMCTADGCTSSYRLQPHHIRHRQHGADNDPRNLTLLCWFHHHVVIHGHGYRVDPHSPPGRLRFLAPTTTGPDPP
jgi:Domain of unknown function (DUF222)